MAHLSKDSDSMSENGFSFLLLLSLFLSVPAFYTPSTPSPTVSPSIFTHRSVTHSLSLLTSPFLVFLHSFFPWLFWVPLPSLLLLLLKPRDAAHLTAAAVSRACLSPCVAATTAVNLFQTRCLFYSLALSRGRKTGGRPNEKAKGLLVFFNRSLPLFSPNKKTRLTVGSGCCPVWWRRISPLTACRSFSYHLPASFNLYFRWGGGTGDTNNVEETPVDASQADAIFNSEGI